MKSHELAKLLLAGPDLDVLTHANNHTVSPYGYVPPTIRVGILVSATASGKGIRTVVIGNFSERNFDGAGNETLEALISGPLSPTS